MTYQQIVFKRYHSDKHFSDFLPTRWRQKSTGMDMEHENNVTVILCIASESRRGVRTSLEQYATRRDSRMPSSTLGELSLSSVRAAWRATSMLINTHSLAEPCTHQPRHCQSINQSINQSIY